MRFFTIKLRVVKLNSNNLNYNNNNNNNNNSNNSNLSDKTIGLVLPVDQSSLRKDPKTPSSTYPHGNFLDDRLILGILRDVDWKTLFNSLETSRFQFDLK